MFLRQSTSQAVKFGPFLDSSDGVTAETALTIAQTDMQLSKDGATFAQKNAAGNATHDADGWYTTTFDATDTATVGEFYMQVNITGALPVWVRYWVIEEVVYDDLYASSAAGYASVAALAVVDTNVDAILIDTGTTLPNSLATIDTNVDAILVDTSTTLPGIIDDLAIKKNTAFSNFEFLMVLTSDHVTPAIGLTVTGQRSIDGGAFASVGGTIAEVSNGIYQFDALAADTNGDVITWRFSSGTADDTFMTFKTVQ